MSNSGVDNQPRRASLGQAFKEGLKQEFAEVHPTERDGKVHEYYDAEDPTKSKGFPNKPAGQEFLESNNPSGCTKGFGEALKHEFEEVHPTENSKGKIHEYYDPESKKDIKQ